MTTDQYINIAIALGTLIAAVFAAFSAWQSRKAAQQISNQVFYGGITVDVSTRGEFHITNRTGEEIEMAIKQCYLADWREDRDDRISAERTMQQISSEKGMKAVLDRVQEDGVEKCSGLALSSNERMVLLNSMTHSLRIEGIRWIIVGTAISFKGTNSKRSGIKIYLHHATRGENTPEPRGEWFQVASRVW